MSARRKLLAIICPNGLGHYRRALEVLDRLADMRSDLHIELVCEAWQRRRMNGWPVSARLEAHSRVSWSHDVLGPAVEWSRSSPAVYADGRLEAWTERLRAHPSVRDADLVLSDNMAGVLELRDDAVLMGSFLWSDVLDAAFPDDPHVQSFVGWERRLLDRHRPPMLCVGAMAMPGVLARTTPVELAWMRKPMAHPHPAASDQPPPDADRIVFLIGKTGALEHLMLETAALLLARGARLALPAEMFTQLGEHPGASLFDFSDDAFASCRLAICRPGMGAIQDCLVYRVPMSLVHEPNNAELAYNGERAAALGLGEYLGEISSPAEIAGRVLALGQSPELGAIRRRMAGARMDGIEQAARWFDRRLDGRAFSATPGPTTMEQRRV